MAEETISIGGYTFDADKGCFACNHVMADQPVLLFCHEADGDLQFMCGEQGHESGDDAWMHAAHVLGRHSSLCGLPIVDPGFLAERATPSGEWVVAAIVD
jgi:hypothetical protein